MALAPRPLIGLLAKVEAAGGKVLGPARDAATVVFDIEVPPEHVDVLDALADRAITLAAPR